MTERENCLKVYNHEIPEWIPLQSEAITNVGNWTCNERGSRGVRLNDTESYDGFGVIWTTHCGESMPAVGYDYVLKDVCEWKNCVDFPNVDKWEWKSLAEYELRGYDGTTVLRYFCEEGLFDRLVSLMGFENALCSLVTEPDACKEFFAEMTEYKLKVIKNVATHFKPDVFMYTDDLAQSTSLFMSPESYRSLIKPFHRIIIKAIKDHGMIPEQHTCGKCEQIIDDYVEIGVESFYPAQPSNDLIKIKDLYCDRLVICGGFNSQGECGMLGASEEVMRAEARRIIDMYARGGGLIANTSNAGLSDPNCQKYIYDEFKKYSKDYYSNPKNRVW